MNAAAEAEGIVGKNHVNVIETEIVTIEYLVIAKAEKEIGIVIHVLVEAVRALMMIMKADVAEEIAHVRAAMIDVEEVAAATKEMIAVVIVIDVQEVAAMNADAGIEAVNVEVVIEIVDHAAIQWIEKENAWIAKEDLAWKALRKKQLIALI